ncbi:secondary thiamine-phosphate synthase enzyme YjbQ [uncultured Methanobrevibacter sp.]|uniref:secondary thiamine-phosphate synthase enzyme YjbQ n=1 Tax=uncultured Methanobrevibacter sp. TaxID=253161 RepID=UPI0025EAEA86|nr:secondary thiamine-phosphate synthase enzyme YjbQ [uncultured Methanobrevibacter sp.]MEE1135222.1 secondary thiamine-phosphate synthase enzyme YjbQ [Methanobrevibacter sp.]
MIIQKSLKLNTSKNFEIIDITSAINDLIDIDNGIISIFSRHSTTAIVVNENESGLLSDFEFMLENLVQDKFTYEHDRIDNNARSHLKSFLLSSSECLPIRNSRLDLGTWQSVFFVELDGPRSNRTLSLTIIGE